MNILYTVAVAMSIPGWAMYFTHEFHSEGLEGLRGFPLWVFFAVPMTACLIVAVLAVLNRARTKWDYAAAAVLVLYAVPLAQLAFWAWFSAGLDGG